MQGEGEDQGSGGGRTEFMWQRALERFVARNPTLRCNPAILNLLAKGIYLKAEDVMDVFPELLLHPHLTVSVIGCFRPHLVKIINNLVEMLYKLWSSGERADKGHEKVVAYEFCEIKLNQAKCWSLKLHEYVVIAFSRSLELAPFLLRSILQYFTFAPPPFERLLKLNNSISMTEKESFHLLDIVRASYRFLHLEPKVFSELWDWSPFLELLQWPCYSNRVAITSETVYDIRWCAVQVLSVVLRMSDEATRVLGYKLSSLTEKMAFECLLRWEEFCQDVALEKAGWYLESKESRNDDLLKSNASYFVECDKDVVKSTASLKSYGSGLASHLEICGIELPVRKSFQSKGPKSTASPFVMTPNIKKSLESVVLAVSQIQPVLLEGPTGAGKTMLINELAQITGNFDVLFIHLDDQMDSKTLIGSYVCTEIPGEFKWQPGSLTQAVVKGFWVIFEDIDKAPSDVLSVLSALLEDRKLHIPGRGESIPAAEGFQLFATITKLQTSSSRGIAGRESFYSLWRKVVIDAASSEDLLKIVKACFPMLEPVAPKLTDTLHVVNSVTQLTSSSSKFGGYDSVCYGQRFSTRDLLKWCKRILDLNLNFDSNLLSVYAREHIFTEAVDIFAASVACKDRRHFVMRSIAELWCISQSQVEYLDQLHKPQIQDMQSMLQIGRVSLHVHQKQNKTTWARTFANTGNTLRSLERVACSVKHNEPILLVGETGTGKTTLVQHLAVRLGVPLTVLNLSQQSDSTDFLGGFKPVNARSICIPLVDVFIPLFFSTFPSERNTEFLGRVQQFVEKKKWDQLLRAFQIAVDKVAKLVESQSPRNIGLQPVTTEATNSSEEGATTTRKRKKSLDREIIEKWHDFSANLHRAQRQIEASRTSFAFSFMEGALVKAMRNGHWLLLDEVNLAPPETLQRLSGVLEGEKGSLCLTEKGDVEYVTRHPGFRIFACMNPATDIGKRDLPFYIKNRFTEFFIDDLLNAEDLSLLVYQYLESMLPTLPIDDIVRFYKEARKESETRLFDGANQKPQYSLRSLARALEYTRAATPTYGFQRALYDGICMLFLTLLDRPSAVVMEGMIASVLLKESGATGAKALNSLLKAPLCPSRDHVQFEQYWIEKGTSQVSKASDEFCKRYVLTKSIRGHLKNLARAVFIRRYPVLLQGPTSSGKTSLIEYLATVTGHRFVRINNHEHTDLQEYLGTYITESSGKLIFQEGILVEAVRKGYWIVLDELNLAPSDVLEALNRLLDDNRELFVPELQATVKPHPHFMLFATQNPPGTYGGRKVLSRAFRNRFLEIHVDDIPEDELCMILERRCEVPPSYASKMVEVMKDLQRHRQSSKVFAGKHGFITPRDLFRWAERFKKSGKSYEDLAMDGYMLLAERLRDEGEKAVVQRILEKHLRVKIDIGKLYSEDSTRWQEVVKLSTSSQALATLDKVVWTKSLRRLFHLVERCYKHREPVLLVGETGSGKTTVCQLLSLVWDRYLHMLNCHQHTESSDFLGGFRPVRDRNRIAGNFQEKVQKITASQLFSRFHQGEALSSKIDDATVTLGTIRHVLNDIRSTCLSEDDCRQLKLQGTTKDGIYDLEQVEEELILLQKDWQSLFLWHDGPLVQAMKNGHFILIDEISLADDSVLERLNSVLEPSQLLVLAEKGGPDLEELTAHSQFFLLATMNPGGDFGKKELSPALRNRFTEIWVPAVTDLDDLRSIVLNRFSKSELLHLADPLLNFWKWFHSMETGRMLTVRDLLSWTTFVNTTEKDIGMDSAFIHGAFLVLLDGLGLGSGKSNAAVVRLKEACLNFLLHQLHGEEPISVAHLRELQYGRGYPPKAISRLNLENNQSTDMFGIDPFYIMKGVHEIERSSFELSAPTTSSNALRILRAMQLLKPVLLEGSPGVGKTSLVAAIANSSNQNLVRINLSEQTDIMDLLGSDLPVEGAKGIEFQWSDGILLQALKAGSWVMLDELNLAPQSVLEGLNAILDHRGEVYVPELGRTFKCPPSFRIFACQNPSHQGGGRKGLPKSFLNRFTKVFVDALHEDDFLFISSALHPSIPKTFLSKLIEFNARLHNDTMVQCRYGQIGSPWEFNLRDVLRSCHLIEGAQGSSKEDCFLNVVYLQRMRTFEDRRQILKLYQEIFGFRASINAFPKVKITPKSLFVGEAALLRNTISHGQDLKSQLHLLPGLVNSLEAVMHCVEQGWMCILVGPSSSGKTSIIRLLAELTGNILREYNLSDRTDTSELLGCFEQYDAFRYWQDTIIQVHGYLEELCAACLGAPATLLSAEESKTVVKDLLGRWAAFQNSVNSHCTVPVSCSTTFNKHIDNGSINHLAIGLLRKIVEHLKHIAKSTGVSISWSDLDIVKLMKILGHLKKTLDMNGIAGHFEWINGGLIKAIERGEWVMLENANLCNPTVLDRLNSLLEPSGLITVNERGLVNGEPMVVYAHPKFRMFLTVNPSHGEVSRAMRNRGIEIYLMQPDWLVSSAIGESEVNRSNIEDLKRFLTLSGLPVSNLIDAMATVHYSLKMELSCFGIVISLREFSQWAQLLQQLLMRGESLSWSLYSSWEQIYLYSLYKIEARNAAFQIVKSHLSNIGIIDSSNWFRLGLSLPGGWPTPLELRKYLQFSNEAIVKRDCMYLEILGAQYASFKISVEGKLSIKLHENNKEDGFILWLKTELPSASFFPSYFIRFFLFPSSVTLLDVEKLVLPAFDAVSIDHMLFYAASWMIEQASFSDLGLRVQWLKWFASKVAPYCQFFKSFVIMVEDAKDHPVGKCLESVWEELKSIFPGMLNLQLLPCFSTKSIESVPLSDQVNPVVKRLRQLIKNFSMLRCVMWQWKIENETNDATLKYQPLDKGRGSVPGELYEELHSILNSLRLIEKEVLIMCANVLCDEKANELFTWVQECHVAFWKAVNRSMFDADILLICWQRLKKSVAELLDYVSNKGLVFPVFESASKNLDAVLFLGSNYSKPLLWKYAGHPMLTSSSEHFHQQQQLLDFCHKIWPAAPHHKQLFDSGKLSLVETAVSTNPDFRYLAMQGVTMALSMDNEGTADWSHKAANECKDIYKMLSERFEVEKKLLGNKLTSKSMLYPSIQGSRMLTSSCKCSSNHLENCFPPEIFCSSSAYDFWVQILPLSDHKSLCLDLVLLKSLSESLLPYTKDQCQVTMNMAEALSRVITFGLQSTSRSPIDFIPHQTLSWLLDAHPLDYIGSTKFSSSVHDMCYRWHSAWWVLPHKLEKNNMTGKHDEEIQGPAFLFQATQTVSLSSFLGEAVPAVKDHSIKLLQLRVVSADLWRYCNLGSGLCQFVFCIASALFQQILLAHWKSFNRNDMQAIQSILCVLHHQTIKVNKGVDPQMLERLKLLLSASSHEGLVNLIETFVQPLIQELYSSDPVIGVPSCSLYKLARVWLLLGGLRLHLLLNSNIIDPATKCMHKYSQFSEKISQLKLEMKVRQECETLIGGRSAESEVQEKASELLQLEKELHCLALKVVYRPIPSKYKAVYAECVDFLESMAGYLKLESLMNLLQDGVSDLPLTISEVQNWQEISSCFILRLSEEYAPYQDFVQPIQLAIYELKFGMSLAVTAFHQKRFCSRVGVNNMDSIVEVLCLLMGFPSGFTMLPSLTSSNNKEPKIEYTSDCGQAWMLDEEVLRCLSAIMISGGADKEVVVLQLKVTVLRICLLRTGSSILQSLVMNGSSMQLLNTIFASLTALWLEMKEKVKGKADHEAEAYRFKPRSCKIDDDLETDELTFSKLFPKESWVSEWEDVLSESVADQDHAELPEHGHEWLEDVWASLEEPLLQDVVRIHSQLFGSTDILQYFGKVQISDEERLHAFTLAYDAGKKFVEGTGYSLPARLDEKILSGHLLRLCLEHQKLSQSSCARYNIYKDSNTYEMALMVEPLLRLQDRVNLLLKEWPEHPGLQQILQIIGTLLGISLNSPLMKALIGVQFLLHRSQLWEENAPRMFSLTDELNPLSSLVSRWRKIEFECWPTLLDAVERHHEVDAEKLWFALHSILFRRMPDDPDVEINSTILSIEEFMQTATIGEFGKRLELLLMFHGQFSVQIRSESYPVYMPKTLAIKLSQITYNIFGYYVQFLPLILQSIEAGRKLVEKELKDCSDLCKWEGNCYYSIESYKKTHQKLQKLVQKFNDILRQPVMELLNQELMKIGAANLDSPFFKLLESEHEICLDKIPSQNEYMETSAAERSCLHSWQQYSQTQVQLISHIASHVYSGSKGVYQQKIPILIEKVESCISQSIFSKASLDMRQEGHKSLEMLWRSVLCRAYDIRKNDAKRSVKKKAFTDLLKVLKSIGLSHHKSTVPKEERDASSWFLQPCFNVTHLLKQESQCTTTKMESSKDINQSGALKFKENNADWRLANEYYFKNMALMQRLRQICLSFHKDLSLREVEISMSFLEHLLFLQRNQRCTAYGFSLKLEKLSKLVLSLKDSVNAGATESTALPSQQHVMYRWMWQQKHLVDCLCTVSVETSLLLKMVGRIHSCSFTSLGGEVNKLQVFIDKFIPSLNNSKASLDKYLLGSHLITVESHKELCTFIISKQMEEAVYQTFRVIKEMKEDISALLQDYTGQDSVMPALNQISDLLFQGVQMSNEFISEKNTQGVLCSVEELTTSFIESHEKTISEILKFTDKAGHCFVQSPSLEEHSMHPGGTLQTWESIFDEQMTNFRLDDLYDALMKTIAAAVKLFNCGAQKNIEPCLSAGNMLGCLQIFVEMILNAGNKVLSDYVDMHKTVAKMDYILSNIFAAFYADGFFVAKEELEEEGDNLRFEDASGTGMGEGEGVKDVSDQIEDEDQLLGGSEKPSEEPTTSQKVSTDPDKGIEMEQDFNTSDMFSVSEDSGDESGDDDQEENIDSAMGKTGEDEDVVDEQLWNKEQDCQPENPKEKYETGASVQDTMSDSMELRAKQDASNDEVAAQDKDSESHDTAPEDSGVGNDENDIPEDLTMNKEDAYTDPTGMQPHAEEEFLSEDMEVEEPTNSQIDKEEQPGSDLDDKTTENTVKEDKEHSVLEDFDMDASEQGGDSGGELQQEEPIETNEINEDPCEGDHQSIESDEISFQVDANHTLPDSQYTPNSVKSNENLNAANQALADGVISDLQNDIILGDTHGEGHGFMKGAFSESVSEPSTVPYNGMETDPSSDPKLSSSSAKELQSLERMNANPFRSIGDALKDWKERVKISDIKSQDQNTNEISSKIEELEIDGGDEFQFVSEGEKSNSQALGAATADQLDENINVNKSITVEEDPTEKEAAPPVNETEDIVDMEDNGTLQKNVKNIGVNTKNEKQSQNKFVDNVPSFSQTVENEMDIECENQDRVQSESFVSIERQHQGTARQSNSQFATTDQAWTEVDVRKLRRDIEMIFKEHHSSHENSAIVWAKYEQLTTRLSQDLAEQLRLIMEPTLASKLEGDYQTGKRINMKKVIPYIASQFQKDKIWLRRTKPNKRQYQIVLAIDDSRSMSESHCGHMAIEALITICRAMSQLEVGQLAVASFGEKGNVRMLHDFDQPFSSEAGLKIISKFSFKQDNTIADEPVVDLLKYLTNLLDHVAMRSRAPSGRTDVQQLVLIIADGRFHEKENLKRCVRDALSRKQLLAFIVLDSPEESIMDVQSVSFTDGMPKFSKYLDSFPFPYYIILKDIEALPRTLADLLRQWFELMQLTNI